MELENFAGEDYSGIDARYTDSIIEAQISQAERWVNAKTQTTFTGTIPDGVKFATNILAKFYMNALLVEDGFLEENPDILQHIINLATELIATKDSIGVDSISINGADRIYYPSFRI